ncbi:MAG: hypothetical protein LBU42_02110 [Prevotellaceae bacterium]|nr:hypothetical protein [Prevotellaceae bacterium]
MFPYRRLFKFTAKAVGVSHCLLPTAYCYWVYGIIALFIVLHGPFSPRVFSHRRAK